MTLRSLIDLVTPRPRGGAVGRHPVRPRESLQTVLETERARTDRSGDILHWVLFGFENDDAGGGRVEQLSEIIACRARQIDEVGWYNDTTVCAILPGTALAGVHCFITDILKLASDTHHLNPSATVHSYPDDRRSVRQLTGRGPQLVPMSGDRGASGVGQALGDSTTAQYFVIPMPAWKRACDVVGASVGLIVTAPILAAAAVAVWLSSPGPVLFVQRRAGVGCQPFSMYKFRSMYVEAEALKAKLAHLNQQDGPAFKIKGDPRITPVGRILRGCSIDELPQLFNVLKGEMSLVGPRPPTFDEVAKYRIWYSRRFDVTPGITCIWQVRGRANVSFETWMRMDIRYIRNFGFWQDLALLLATVPAVLSRRGAH